MIYTQLQFNDGTTIASKWRNADSFSDSKAEEQHETGSVLQIKNFRKP